MNTGTSPSLPLNMPTIRSRLTSVVAFATLIGLLIFGGYLRINMVLDSVIQKDLWADSHIYFTYAYNLRKHGVYSHFNVPKSGAYVHSDRVLGSSDGKPVPDDVLSPGYPLLVYLFLADLPDHLDIQNVKPHLFDIKMAQAILSTVTILITFLMSRYLLPTALALVPALIVAIAPHLIIANLYVLTESAFCFVLTLVLLLIVWSYGKSPVHNIVVGALTAIGALIKPAFLYFLVPLCLVYGFLIREQLRGRVLGFVILGFALVYSPWVLRNQVSPDVMSDESLVASTLLAGAYPNLVYDDDPRSYPYPFLRDPDYKKNARDTSSALIEIKRRFLERPAEFVKWYLLGKPILLWRWDITHGVGGAFVYPVADSPYHYSDSYKFTYDLSRLIHWPLVILGLIGSIIAWLPPRRNVLSERAIFGSRVISLALFYFMFVHAVTFADARYAVPLRPLLSLMALLPLYHLSGSITAAFSAQTRK